MSRPIDPAFDETTLLQIAVAEFDLVRAEQAWRLLCARLDGEAGFLKWVSGHPGMRLLPMLDQRTELFGAGDELRQRCRYEAMQAWGMNVRLFDVVGPVVERLRNEGVVPIGFKGIALLGDVYPDHRRRAVGDIDVLIGRHELPVVLHTLGAQGWQLPWRARDHARFGSKAVTVWHRSGAAIDLHFRPARNLPHRRHAERWPSEPVPENHPLAATGLERLAPLRLVFVQGLHAGLPSNRRHGHQLVDLYRLAVEQVRSHRAPSTAELLDLARLAHVEYRLADQLARLSEVFDPAPLGSLGGAIRLASPSRSERKAVAAGQRYAARVLAGEGREPGIAGVLRRMNESMQEAGAGQGPFRQLQAAAGYLWTGTLLVRQRRHLN